MLEFLAPQKINPLRASAADIEAWAVTREPRAIREWNELGTQEYERAFTAAQTAGADVIDDLYFGFVDVVSRRGTEQDFKELVTPILKQKGWLGGDDGAIANRVALIYDTNLRQARAAGRWQKFQLAKSVYPYVRAFTVGDERVRHPPKSPASDHRAWDGIVLPIDHWFWTIYWPPLGFRCRCAVVQMSRSELARRKDGITTEEDLEYRIKRLGPPVFASPVTPMPAQLASMVESSNAERMPGRPATDPNITARKGDALWEAVLAQKAFDQVTEALNKLFGL